MNSLFLIPARGGSKGLPKKNIKPLNGKPLIQYSTDLARALGADEHICVSTDDQEIIEAVEASGLRVPFTRPHELSTDTASSYDVIIHALDFYAEQGISYDSVVLLQPTSPLRTIQNVKGCMTLYTEEIDAVISVKQAEANPYFTLFEEDKDGYLQKSKTGKVSRRQDMPEVLELNGAIYVLNTKSLRMHKSIPDMPKKVKYEMSKLSSVDIDDNVDFQFCEFLLNNGTVTL